MFPTNRKFKPAGWDTVDELLSSLFGWKVVTDASLIVKHLKPTGANHNKTRIQNKREVFDNFRLRIPLSHRFGKTGDDERKPLLFIDYIKGF
jgi:hypothetical protein